MIKNVPSKSLRSKARNMGVSEFLISKVMHENIRYFSCKLRKGHFLISCDKEQEERLRCKDFEQTQTSSPT